MVVLASAGFVLVGRLFDGVYDQASAILDVLAIASIAGSMLVYSRIKAALVVSESAAKSWESEADAQKERADRNADLLKQATLAQTELIAKNAALEQRPDLTKLEHLVAESTSVMKDHEAHAGERTERLIEAVQSLQPPTQEAA